MKQIDSYIIEKLHIGKDYTFDADLKSLIEDYFLTNFDEYVKKVEVHDDIKRTEERIDVDLHLKRKDVMIKNLNDKVIPELCDYLHDYKFEYEFASCGVVNSQGYQYFTIVPKNETDR